jgi:Thioredoxin
METQEKNKLSTPHAIIITGFMVALAIVATYHTQATPKEKTLSEQVSVSREKLKECVAKTDTENKNKEIAASVESAMSHYAREERGTPFSIVISKNGVTAEIRGADSFESIQNTIKDVTSNTVKDAYKGTLPPVTNNEHIFGDISAPITIVEYSDFECPYCKQFHATMKRVVLESNKTVRWVYRHYPLHQHSFEKLVAADCVAQIQGNDAFWKYADLLFGLLKTQAEQVSEKL